MVPYRGPEGDVALPVAQWIGAANGISRTFQDAGGDAGVDNIGPSVPKDTEHQFMILATCQLLIPSTSFHHGSARP